MRRVPHDTILVRPGSGSATSRLDPLSRQSRRKGVGNRSILSSVTVPKPTEEVPPFYPPIPIARHAMNRSDGARAKKRRTEESVLFTPYTLCAGASSAVGRSTGAEGLPQYSHESPAGRMASQHFRLSDLLTPERRLITTARATARKHTESKRSLRTHLRVLAALSGLCVARLTCAVRPAPGPASTRQ
jgi:hypothetical protein